MCSGEPSGLQTDTRGALASAVVLQGKLGSGHAPGGRPRNAGGAVDEPRAAAQQPAADRRPPPCPRPLGAVTQLADGAAALHLRRGQPARIRGSGLPSLIASAPEARTGHAPRASTRSRQPRHAKSRIRLFSPPLKRYVLSLSWRRVASCSSHHARVLRCPASSHTLAAEPQRRRHVICRCRALLRLGWRRHRAACAIGAAATRAGRNLLFFAKGAIATCTTGRRPSRARAVHPHVKAACLGRCAATTCDFSCTWTQAAAGGSLSLDGHWARACASVCRRLMPPRRLSVSISLP